MIKVRAIVVKPAGSAQYHIRAMIGMKRSTAIVGMVEPPQLPRGDRLDSPPKNALPS